MGRIGCLGLSLSCQLVAILISKSRNLFIRFNNDIAIITVKEPFDFSDPKVQPIDWFKKDDPVIPGDTICNNTGWGLTNGINIALPNALQWIQIPLHSDEECRQEPDLGSYITEGMVCAGSAGHASCNGDSGGPLVCPDASGKGKLAGIVSFGMGGCTSMGVYAKVSQYDDWIQERLIA